MRHHRFFDVSQSGDVVTFENRLVDFANDLDFGIISAVLVVERPGKDAAFISLGNTPTTFLEASRDPEASKRDPVMKSLKNLSVPFYYDQSTYVQAGASDLWEQQAPYGFRNGISVAVHLPDRKHFLLGIDRDKPLPRSDQKLTRLFADLQLMAVHAQDAAVRLLGREDAPNPRSVPKLTPRELEVLKWTMEGQSAWSVAKLIGISEHTVNFHMRNALLKLDSSSKHQAVLKAIGMGLL